MMRQLKWLWGNMDVKYRKWHILAIALSVVTSAMLLINPALSQRLIDDVILAKNPEPLLGILGLMLLTKLVREAMRYCMIITLETTSQNVLYNLRSRLFSRLQHNDFAFFNQHRAGDLMTRMSADVDWCRHFLSSIDFRIVDSVCIFLFTTLFLLTVNWQLTLTLVVVTPVLMLITKVYSKHIRPRFFAMRERLSEMNAAAQENIAGNRVVKAFAREEYEKEKFTERNNAFRQSHLNINKLWLSFYPLIELLANAIMLITIFLGGFFIIKGKMTPGELSVFTSLSWALSWPMRELGNLLNDLQRFSTCAAKVMEIDCARPSIVDSPDAVDHDSMQGRIEFRNVSFSFDRKQVLEDVSFTVEPGQTVAIMGPTGGGKTTLINLLSRCYDATEGEVMVDGCDVRDWKLSQLRSRIGVATQDVFLFSDTVEGNIAFGNQSLTVDEVKDFAARADAAEFVERLGEGYDTIIGERGVGLSGGQRQRIALARALAMKPGILVMDDTTSAVDSETEQYIQEQLRSLPYACTKVIIAQRISSMRDADLILVIRDGRIAERGTHDELMRMRGYYYETCALQNDLTCGEVM
ncbi:MAG: ABC transporter ATP-binding protein [Clostridia bacterium]|nr:ABC transporter ATP-binding protein [Clostridia bacterium]